MLRARKAASDPSRFEGEGISFKAKLIGIEDVKEARGDQMCQEALFKLKNSVRITGSHKKKILITITLEGLKIIDAISLVVLHTHAVHQISFISRDATDSRAFGYIYETEDGLHKFFAIKTATAAEQLVLAMKDLFQAVFEAKKKEANTVSEKQEKEEISADDIPQISGNGPTSGDGQAPNVTADAENKNEVTADSADINQNIQTGPVANLLDFEDKGEIKDSKHTTSLEFDFLTVDSPSSPSSTQTTAVTTTEDPWGLSETSAKPAVTSSALGDLAGLQTGPFSTRFPVQSGFGGSSSFNTVTGGLPVTTDPFGSDPFSSFNKQPSLTSALGSQQPAAGPGFATANPFGSEFNQPYGIQGIPPRVGVTGVYGMFPGVVPHGMMSQPVMGSTHNPFAAQQPAGLQVGNPFGDSDSHLASSDSASSDALKARSKSPHNDLFGDLFDIKKSSPAGAKSSKDMFVLINAAEKKSMNELIVTGASPRASPLTVMQAKPGISPRDSPLTVMQAKPGISPRASPLTVMQPKPGISPRASPLTVMQAKPGISPQPSPVPTAQAIPPQSSPFDDFFGAPAEQAPVKSLFD